MLSSLSSVFLFIVYTLPQTEYLLAYNSTFASLFCNHLHTLSCWTRSSREMRFLQSSYLAKLQISINPYLRLHLQHEGTLNVISWIIVNWQPPRHTNTFQSEEISCRGSDPRLGTTVYCNVESDHQAIRWFILRQWGNDWLWIGKSSVNFKTTGPRKKQWSKSLVHSVITQRWLILWRRDSGWLCDGKRRVKFQDNKTLKDKNKRKQIPSSFRSHRRVIHTLAPRFRLVMQWKEQRHSKLYIQDTPTQG